MASPQAVVSIRGTLAGTGIPLGQGRILTNWHLVVNTQTLSVDGDELPYRIAESGDLKEYILHVRRSASAAHDWVVLQLSKSFEQPLPIDFHRDLKPGDTIYLMGCAGQEGSADGPGELISAQVAKRPLFVPTGRNVVLLDAPSTQSYHGLSGGAACIWDRDRQTLVIVGTYVGNLEWQGGAWQIIVQPPLQ